MPACTLCKNSLELTKTGNFYDYVISQTNTWNICPDCVENQEVIPCGDCGKLYPHSRFENPDYYTFTSRKGIQNTIRIVISTSIIYRAKLDSRICTDCTATERYYYCAYCEELDKVDFGTQIGRETYCADCLLNHRRAINYRRTRRVRSQIIDKEIFPYSEKPLEYLKFLGKPKDKIFYGIELELECRDFKKYDLARRTNQTLEGFAILKNDGSLGCGFEIVTAPATLEIHADRWQKFFNKLNFSLERGLFPTDRAGLHIHVSRHAMSTLTIGKLIVFVNDSKYRDKITQIAGRISDYAKLKPYKKITDAKRKNNDRYEAINLKNADTIEFRIFASTTSYPELMMRLEFVAASIHFCSLTSIEQLKHLEWQDFEDWIATNRKQYRYLHSFLNDIPVAA